MPVYTYRVVGDDHRFEITHSMSEEPQTWGDLCKLSDLEVARYDSASRVERLIVPVAARVSQFTSDLKNGGFRRLERRDSGVYEDVTAPKGPERFLDAN